MNEALLSAIRSLIHKNLLLNIYKTKFNLSLFTQYDNLNEIRYILMNRLATSYEIEEFTLINDELQKVNDAIANVKENLFAIGVSSDMENAEDIRVMQEVILDKYQTKANILYKDIETDKQNITDWNVDNTEMCKPILDKSEDIIIDLFANTTDMPITEDNLSIGEDVFSKPIFSTTVKNKEGETKSELEKAQEEYKKDLQEFVNLLNEEEK